MASTVSVITAIVFLVVVCIFEFIIICNLRSQLFSTNKLPKSLSNSVQLSPQFHLEDCPQVLSSAIQRKIAGVAVTVFMGSPKWWQNRYSMMVNQMLAALPNDWAVQIFYNPKKKMAVEATRYPGILRQIEKGNVFLTEIPASLQKLKKNDLLLSSFFWEQARAETVLLFGGNSVLCANSPLNVSYFMSKGLQYVGSPWHSLKGVGGAGDGSTIDDSLLIHDKYSSTLLLGDLSLRNRTLVLQTIRNLQKSGRQSVGNAVKEDAVIVRSLLESKVRVATQQDTHNFAMFDATAFGRPLGGVGTLGGLDDITRQKYVDYCPELKMMFPSLHGPACFGSDPDAIGCFQYLCNAGGLKCNKKNSSVSWIDQKMNKRVTIRIES